MSILKDYHLPRYLQKMDTLSMYCGTQQCTDCGFTGLSNDQKSYDEHKKSTIHKYSVGYARCRYAIEYIENMMFIIKNTVIGYKLLEEYKSRWAQLTLEKTDPTGLQSDLNTFIQTHILS